MKFIKPIIIISSIALLASGGFFALKQYGVDPVKAINQARCESGGLLTASTQAGAVAADSDNGSGAGANSAALSKAPLHAATATGNNLIPNPELKGVNGMPDGWLNNIYGTSKAKFSMLTGPDSKPALRVDITEFHQDDDADWYYPSVPVSTGGYYAFHDSYLSNVNTRPVLMFHHTSGAIEYINLRVAPASTEWTNYDTTFFIPEGVDRILVFHPLTSVGTLETQHYSLTPSQSVGFSEPLVSLTFDDGWKSIHDNALPLMKRYNVTSTQYLISGYLGRAKDYMSAPDVYDMMAAGNEIGSHTVDHLDLAKATEQVAKYEISQSKKDLAKCFATPANYAAPYGTYTPVTNQIASQTYATSRSTDVGFNTVDNLNPYGLVVQNVAADTTQDQIQDWLATAKAHNAWLILVYHQIDSSDSHYARKTADFEKDLQSIKASSLPVKTVQDAYSEIKPQAKK